MGLIYPNASIPRIKSTFWLDYITITANADGGFSPGSESGSRQDGVKIRARSIEMNGWEPEPFVDISEWEGKS